MKNGHSEKKQKITLNDKDVAQLNHNKSHNKEKKHEKPHKSKEVKKDDAGSDSGKDMAKVMKTTTVKDMLRAKRDSMRNMVDSGGSKSENTEDSDKESSDSENSSDSGDGGEEGDEEVGTGSTNNNLNQSDIKLPENLSTELLENIKQITDASKTAGKSNFFDIKNMDLLFRYVGGVYLTNTVFFLSNKIFLVMQFFF